MVSALLEGWLLGLSTAPYCAGACAPFLVPYLISSGGASWRATGRIVGEFLTGRLLAYLAVGAAVGWAGEALRPHLNPQLFASALALSAALMILHAVVRIAPRWRVCAWAERRFPLARVPLALGVLIGLNLCPPFLVAMTRLLQRGGVATGLVFFLGFFAGTALLTLPLISLSPLARNPRLARIGTYAGAFVGLWFLLSAL